MARVKKEEPRQMVDGVRRAKDLIHWEARVFTGRYNAKGNPIYEWVYGDSEKEVKEKRDVLKYKIKNNLYVKPTEVTLGEYLDEWIELHKANIAETTYDLYKMYIKKHIKPKIGDIKLSAILPMTLQKFYNEKLQPGPDIVLKNGTVKKGKALKNKTVRKFHILLREALENAKLNNLILNNPADNVQPPKSEKFVPQIMKEDDYFKLLEAVAGTYDEVYILLAGGLGLRRGEVLGLRWCDVDFKNKIITINQSITRFTKEVVKMPKNESSMRTIAVPQHILDALEEYKRNKKVIQLDGRICDQHKPQSYSKHFKALLEKHNLPPVRFHDLRHFNAIIMMMKGIPDKVAAETLGHAQVSTLREIYQHVLDDAKRSVANTMDEFFAARK